LIGKLDGVGSERGMAPEQRTDRRRSVAREKVAPVSHRTAEVAGDDERGQRQAQADAVGSRSIQQTQQKSCPARCGDAHSRPLVPSQKLLIIPAGLGQQPAADGGDERGNRDQAEEQAAVSGRVFET